MVDVASDSWFSAKQIKENLFLITEPFFFEGNRCNIWLIKGDHTDLLIDCGLGVCNLRTFLEERHLLDSIDKPNARPCVVVCTHVHFDHSGGAKDFDKVYIHNEETGALKEGNSIYTLNWVKDEHFIKKPTENFIASRYCVKKTNCHPLSDGEKIMIGEDEHLQVMHLPGHSRGSIALYYPKSRAVFVGDIVYECGTGSEFLDWMPHSSVNQYIRSCTRLHDFLESSDVSEVYPGHFNILTPERTKALLLEYVECKKSILSRGVSNCLQLFSTVYFKCR